MSDDLKNIKFREITQEIRFKDKNNSKKRLNTYIKEESINNTHSEDYSEDKIPIINHFSDDHKFMMGETVEKDISLDVNEDKISLDMGTDTQELSNNSVSAILENNLLASERHSDHLPITRRKKFIKKESVPTSENYIHKSIQNPVNDIENDRGTDNYKTQVIPEQSLKASEKQSGDDIKDDNEGITRVKFSSFNSSKSKNGFSNGKNKQGSFFTKKIANSKPDYIQEEESNGVTRTSSFKKPQKKKSETLDDEGYVRSSSSPKKSYSSNTKKVFVYNEAQLYNYGINRLSEQNYARHELFKKMKNLQTDEIMINRVLDKLTSQKYLNDDNRIRSFIMSYSNSESINKTKQRLIQKGFDKKEIQRVFDEMSESAVFSAIQNTESEEDKAIALLIRKYRIYEEDKRDKMSRFLISRGFPFDVVSQTMKTFSNGEYDSYDPYS